MNWQPIETAPKDGTWFLTYSPDADDPLDFAVYVVKDECFGKIRCGFQYATHWMALPAFPQDIQG